MNTFIAFLIHSVNTFFDLAGMISVCFPDAFVLLTAISGSAFIPALSVIVRGHIQKAIPAGIRRRHGGISAQFSRIDCNIIQQPHPL
jgi:hypothetical protein